MSRATQRDRLRALFETKIGKPIPLPEILALGVAQYNARIFELRRDGYDIRSDTVTVVNGQKHTTFTYHGRKSESPLGDWYEREHGSRPPERPQGPDAPLFETVTHA